uniref:Uncharacterized protein n=1 Tax=Anas platyrhynchos platyrhynchos TaxID=8840 RepID=A0A493SUH3_ANAPP
DDNVTPPSHSPDCLNTNDRQFLTSLPYLHATNQPVLLLSFPHTHTHKFKHVPVKDVVVGEALAVEEVAEELPQVGVVGFVIKPQRAAEVEVYNYRAGCQTLGGKQGKARHRFAFG